MTTNPQTTPKRRAEEIEDEYINLLFNQGMTKDGLTIRYWIKFPFIVLFVVGGVLISLPVIFFRAWGALADKFFRGMNRG